MANFEFDVDAFLKQLDFSEDKVRKGATRGMDNVTNDLLRVSSDIAPIDKGTLSRSGSKEVDWKGDTIIGEVTFSVTEKNGNDSFNYALWTHEEVYNHGETTMTNPPAQGMSGRSYYSGRKYLERPLKGESDTYKEHIANEIRKEFDMI